MIQNIVTIQQLKMRRENLDLQILYVLHLNQDLYMAVRIWMPVTMTQMPIWMMDPVIMQKKTMIVMETAQLAKTVLVYVVVLL